MPAILIIITTKVAVKTTTKIHSATLVATTNNSNQHGVDDKLARGKLRQQQHGVGKRLPHAKPYKQQINYHSA